VAALRTAAIRPASLDAALGDDDSSRLGDVVPDEAAASPAATLEHRTTTAKALELVKRLPDREASILRFRFGLDGGSERTLEEVGKKFGVTRERIRQLQNLALGKLKNMLEEDLDALGVTPRPNESCACSDSMGRVSLSCGPSSSAARAFRFPVFRGPWPVSAAEAQFHSACLSAHAEI
jgi:hypothetical protein